MGGGGKGGGGGGHTPIEKPNTLESAQRLKIIDLLCEGVAGQDVTFKNIYLDNTPIQNSDGTYNFTGIRVSALPGTHNQDYLAGFDSTDKIVAVGAEVKAATPITRTITDPLVDSVRVTLALGSLVTMTDKGDRVGGSVSLTVMCGNKSYPVTISGKTTSAYHQDVILTELPDAPFNISVQRNTPDSTTDKTSNATHWVSYVESIDAKFSYPNSVVVGLEIDSAQFGGKIPTRTYRNKWTQIKVPNNYDPITRTYEGIWLGEFKTAWSDNPAWVFYDLVTDKRYGLGDRLGDFGCDKWSLYQIAKYCDQIVPDGFGGEEPRFTCNAYLSEPRDAKSLLDDLASVFRGIAVWDGQMVTALQDAKKDPVATYSNSNVVDGMFAYSGAAQKSIFTAVHVKYNDKTDNFATKTEYVANDEAIKRYGLNVKQITAFGCTSRGQAARVGKWLIETSIRERQMVSFSVGREGIRHLPFDIIEIADNDYAGDMIGGRVLSVTGNTITVDRPMSNVSSIRYYANGQSKTINVTATNDNTIMLVDTPVGIEQLGVFSATKADVKPRLFRALSIAEDDGTYTISAVQHDENKEAVVDQGVTFEQDSTATKHKPQVSYGTVSKDGDNLVISWEGTNAVQYLIKIYKDGQLYNSYTQDTAEIKLKGLSNGDYRAEIRGKSANGELTEPVIKEWSIDYDIKGLKATPELFAIKLDWTNPTTVINKAKIEIYRSLSNNRATATKVATLSYPTDTFTQNGVKLSETHYFWLRLIDDQSNTGDWVTVSGQCSSDTSQIVASINGKITQTELSQSLIDGLQYEINSAKNQAIGSASTDAANKVAAEAQARQQALAAQAQAQTDALIDTANQLGTQISEVSVTTGEQAQEIITLTSKQDALKSGLEKERTARIAGDAAEATARQTLVSQVNGNKTSITNLQSTKASKTEVSSLARTALQSEWRDDIDGLEIGGRNHARNFDNWRAHSAAATAVVSNSANTVNITCTSTTSNASFLSNEFTIKGKFAISVNVKTTGVTKIYIIGRNTFLSTSHPELSISSGGFLLPANFNERITIYQDAVAEHTDNWYFGIYRDSETESAEFSYPKLEKGNKATDWTPAPEDVAADIDVVSSELTSFKQTTAQKDQAQTIVNNQALSRIGSAESSITSLQSTKASKTEVSSLARTALQSEWRDDIDNLEIGGRNYVDDSLFSSSAGWTLISAAATADRSYNITDGVVRISGSTEQAKHFQYYSNRSDAISNVGDGIYTFSVEARCVGGSDKRAWYALRQQLDNGHGAIYINNLTLTSEWVRYSHTFTINNASNFDRWRVILASSYINTIEYKRPKIEKGNKATDWTPAPEDVDLAITATQASIDEFKQTQASKDQAQTVATNQALSRIGDAESSITNLQSTKASKTEVVSLARTGLQSEWQSAANTAKQQAIDAAKADAEAKANAAKSAAQEYANAQVNAKSVSDKAYADGLISAEERRAINDANAKLAAAKADAKAKADAAESAAKAHADAQVDAIEIGGRNLITQSIFPDSSAITKGEWDLTPTSTGTTGQVDYLGTKNAILLRVSHPNGYILKTAKVYESVGEHTVSFWIKGNKAGSLNVSLNRQGPETSVSVTTSWVKHSITINVTSTSNRYKVVFGGWSSWSDTTLAVYLSHIKVEKGNKATDWSPAPEDVDLAITATQASIDEFKQTQASKDQAQTVATNQALSRIGTAEGNITTLQNTSVTKDKAQSTHTIKTQAIAGGKRALAGIAVGAMANETTAESQVIVMADKFGVVKNAADGVVKPMLTVVNNQVAVNGDLIADGTILGKHIKANQTLTSPVINGGELNINNRFMVDKYGNLTGKSGRFEGTVLADKLDGLIGIESMKRSAWLPSWDVYPAWSTQFDTPNKVPRDNPASHASRGAITYMWGGSGIGSIVGILFEMRVYCSRAVTVTQKVHVRAGVIKLYINETLVDGSATATVQLPLSAGFNLIQYFIRDTSHNGVGAIIGGNFVDNDVIKFA